MSIKTKFLTDGELSFLDEFLLNRFTEDSLKEGKDEGIFDISTLDGYLTAIVSGPQTIMPSVWLSEMWGDFEPEWESENQAQQVISLLMQHMNSIAIALLEHPENFSPIFLEHKTEDKTYSIVDEWCEGYLRGLLLSH